MSATKILFRNRMKEWLRYSHLTTWSASRLYSNLARWSSDPIQRLHHLDRALRVSPSPERVWQLRPLLDRVLASLRHEELDWATLEGRAEPSTDLPKGIILKPPISDQEKGVIYLTFENQWIRLLRSGQAEAIARDYDLVLGPSFSPPPEVALLLMLRFWPGRLYSLLSNLDNAPLMEALSPKLHPIPLLSSSWVDPTAFEPYLNIERDTDIVMLANFATFKRHWVLFDALRRLPKSTRVLLMGVPLDGRTELDIRQEARAFGVEDRCEIIVRPSREQLMHGLSRGRCSVILSRQEGGCIAVAESLFADTPVGLLRQARVGSRAFINEQTGMLLDEKRLPDQLEELLARAGDFSPRSWALHNISCHASLALLNQELRQQAVSQGSSWTCDLLPIVKGLVPSYLSSEDAFMMREHQDRFQERFGLQIGSSPIDLSLSRENQARISLGS